MSGQLFGQIVLLIVIFAVVKNGVDCLHAKFCKMCKP
jgi:hypothetical protein